ncbi:MAG: TetR/AcrR family transcriptional regulator [Actinomycetota bacterium]|nr:TetR/AcrR family transcriptional regulator [Actinomycetota bacterium]
MTTAPLSKGERTREAILARAVEEAARIGLGGLTIGALATATGLSKSGLYAHFGSKDALQVAVLESGGMEFSDAVILPALRAPRGLARLRTLVDLWLTCGRRRQPGGCLVV